MKKIAIIFSLILCAFTISAQVPAGPDFMYRVFTVDTLTDAETLTFAPSFTLDGVYEYEWQILVDSLSGATAGTASVYSSDDGSNWAAVDSKTLTINGLPTQTGGFITGTAYGKKHKLTIAGSGTQSTKITVSCVYKRIGAYTPEVYNKKFTVDSTDAAESIYFEAPFNLRGRYYYSWQVVYDEVSGSATSTAQLQEGCDNQGTRYFNVSGVTSAQTGDATARFEGTCYGTNQQMKLTQSTTGKWRYTVSVTFKRIR